MGKIEKKKISSKALMKTAWRVLLFENSINFERMQSLSFTFSMIPVLKDLYKDKKEDFIKALQRHLEFFNSNVLASSFIVGIAASMEEGRANGEPFTDETINSVKAGLMGPGAGIGDALFWGTFVPIVGGMAAAMALKGQIYGPIFHQVIRVGLWILAVLFGVKFGYKGGTSTLQKVGEAGIQKITRGASLLAATVIGGLVATLVHAKTGVIVKSGGVIINLQTDLLDQIAPNLIPLLLFLLIFFLISKLNWSPIVVIGCVFIFGIVASYLNFLIA